MRRNYVHPGNLPRRRVHGTHKAYVHTGYPPSDREGKFYGVGRNRRYGVVVEREVVQEVYLEDPPQTWIAFTILTPKLEYVQYKWLMPEED